MAARFLMLAGYSILSRNQRWAGVEVDLVARQDDLVVLVEVKLRRTGAAVGSVDACRPGQQARLRRAAAAVLARYPWAEAVRIDVVGVEADADGLRLQCWRGAAAG